MCVGHKHYWQCCRLVDSKNIDPCPRARAGLRCDIEIRIHPLDGCCAACRKLRGMLRDDTGFTSPHFQHDNRKPQCDQPKYKPIKSQPLKFSSYAGCPTEPARGRTRTRNITLPQSDTMDKAVEPKQIYSSRHTEQSDTTSYPRMDKDEKRRLRRWQEEQAQIREHNEALQQTKGHMRQDSHMNGSVTYRVASPKTVRRLQRQGILPHWD